MARVGRGWVGWRENDPNNGDSDQILNVVERHGYVASRPCQ